MVLATSTGGIIVISIAIFFVVIILLVALLVFAGKKLLPQGKVKITINDEKDLEVDPGGGRYS
jgi:Na+-transporting NADH:ubiquinone oxidoreductase subunit F